MSLPLPNLDDRTYDDLLEEMRARIPSLSLEWTDHNPSDPGITLLELFTWLTEMLLYRVNRVPDETVRTFLRLLNGPQWQPGPDLAEDIRAFVLDLRRPYRAVTAADYEALALQVEGVARARCVPRRNLEEGSEPRPGWVSLIVVPRRQPGFLDQPSPPSPPRPSTDLLAQVAKDLEPGRLLTVQHAVVSPLYAPVAVKVRFARRPGSVLGDVKQAIEDFLDPYYGGPEGDGWPFGRDVYVSEIHQVLEAVPGLDYVTDVQLANDDTVIGAGFENASEIPPGLRLGRYVLPWVTDVTVTEE
ncbi:MAG TPA: baseplate J/gp47 family protein [Thermoanaerobaculia bacterium]